MPYRFGRIGLLAGKLTPAAIVLLIVAASTIAGCVPTDSDGTLPPSSNNSQPGSSGTTPPVSGLPSGTVIIFDFDSGSTPAGLGTPLYVESGGLSATFSSPADHAAFSVQNYNSTFLNLSLSGNYLIQNSVFQTYLHIQFSQPVSNLSLKFATMESHGVGNVGDPTNILLTAFMDSAPAIPVGSATARGTFIDDIYPQGTLSFSSAGQPFNFVVIEIPYVIVGARAFIIDEVTVIIA